MKNDDKKNKDVTVYFDGDCPMCKTFVPWLEDDKKNNLPKNKDSVKFENLRTQNLPNGITKDKAIEKIHLVDKNGDILTGAKAVFTAMEQNTPNERIGIGTNPPQTGTSIQKCNANPGTSIARKAAAAATKK